MNILIPAVFRNPSAYQAFLSYLDRGAEFYDGMKSKVEIITARCGDRNGTVDHVFKQDSLLNGIDLCNMTALTCSDLSPNQTPMLRVFWDPRAISGANYGKQDMNIAILFHEALHGVTKFDDPQLQTALGCPNTGVEGSSLNITYYLLQFIPEKVDGTSTPKACSLIKVPDTATAPTTVKCAW